MLQELRVALSVGLLEAPVSTHVVTMIEVEAAEVVEEGYALGCWV